MNDEIQNDERKNILHRWLGRHEALDLVARTCSAADVKCLKEIRDEKYFLEVAESWDAFCGAELRSSRRKIDRMIRQLEELGPAYFELSKLTRVTAEEFKQLGPATAEGIEANGEIVEFKPENREKLEAAVAAVRKGRKSARRSFRDVLELCDSLAEKLEEPPALPDAIEKIDLAAALYRMHKAAQDLGVINVEVRL